MLPPACPAPALPAAPPACATAQALHIKTVPAKTNTFFFIFLSPPGFKVPHSISDGDHTTGDARLSRKSADCCAAACHHACRPLYS